MKIADIKINCRGCKDEFPATDLEFDYATGGCDSCGYGSSASLTASGTCPTCKTDGYKSIVV